MNKYMKKTIVILLITVLSFEMAAFSAFQFTGTAEVYAQNAEETEQSSTLNSVDTSTTAELASKTTKTTKKTTTSKKKNSKKSKAKVKKYTITFIDEEYPNEGKTRTVKKLKVAMGSALGSDRYPMRDDPDAEESGNKIFLGYYFDNEPGECIYAFNEELAYNKNITVYARYGSYNDIVDDADYVYEYAVETDFTVKIKTRDGGRGSVKEVRQYAWFYRLNGDFQYVKPANVKVKSLGGGMYNLSLKKPIRGNTYGLYLSGEYEFVSATDMKEGPNELEGDYNFITFTYYKETKDVVFNPSIKWLSYGKSKNRDLHPGDIKLSTVESKDLGTDDTSEDADEKTYLSMFKFDGGSAEVDIEVGDTVCVFKGTCPKDRKYSGKNSKQYLKQDGVYYAVVTDKHKSLLGGYTYTTRYIEDEEMDRIFYVPVVIPFRTGSLPSGSGTVNLMQYDSTVWTAMEQSGTPEPQEGDFVVFYDELSDSTEASDLVFGEVTYVNGNEINYELTDYDTVVDTLDNSTEFYVKPELTDDYLVNKIDTDKIVKEFENELQNNEELSDAMLQMVAEAAEIPELSGDYSTLSGDDDSSSESKGAKKISIEDKAFKVTCDKNTVYLTDDGAKLALRVGTMMVIKVVLNDNSVMRYVVSANFTQEVLVNVKADGEFKVGWHFIIPYIKDCWFSISLDMEEATDFTLDVRHYVAANKDEYTTAEKDWAEFVKFLKSDEFLLYGSTYLNAESEYELKKNSSDATEKKEATAAKTRMDTVWSKQLKTKFDSCWTNNTAVSETAKKKTTFAQVRTFFNEFALNTTIVELLGTPEEGLDDTNMKAFIAKYKEMMSIKNTWMTLYKKVLVDDDQAKIPIVPGALDVTFEPTFYVELNINVALNANFHMEYGKEFTVKVDILDWDITSSSADIMNQKLSFKLLTMGTLGIRCGVRTDIGMQFLSVFTVALTADVGPYAEADGYAFYEVDKDLSSGGETTTKAKGALYIEIGIRTALDFKIKVKVFGSKSWNIYTWRVRILWFGEKENVYKYNYDQLSLDDLEDESNLCILNPTTDFKVADRWRDMGYMDMTSGAVNNYVAKTGHYTYKFYKTCPLKEVSTDSGTKLKYDSSVKASDILKADSNGKISRTDGVDKAIQMYCVMTWKEPSLAFSNYVIRRCFKVLYTPSENIKRYNLNIQIKDADTGETEIVYTQQRVEGGRVVKLPSKSEILDMADAGGYKYERDSAYYEHTKQELSEIVLNEDTTLTLVAKRKTYCLDLHMLTQDNKEQIVHYYAKYGELFDISYDDLDGSTVETHDESGDNYLRFSYINPIEVRAEGEGLWNRNWEDPIDAAFASQLLEKTSNQANNTEHYLQAVYESDNITVTYQFEGVNYEPLTKTVRYGSVAPTLAEMMGVEKESDVRNTLRKAAGLSDSQDNLMEYTITPEPDSNGLKHNTTFLVQVTAQTLTAPWVKNSYMGNVDLTSANTVADGETLLYGYALSADAKNNEIVWFDDTYIPNLLEDTDYYFFCKKVFRDSPSVLISGPSERWSWHGDRETEKIWANGVHISTTYGEPVNVTVQIVYMDKAKSEKKTIEVVDGDYYTGALEENYRDPWMIDKIYVETDDEWEGAVNTYSYYDKATEEDPNRSNSSSKDVEFDDADSGLFTVKGPKRMISEVGNFDEANAGEDGALPDVIDIGALTKAGTTRVTYTYDGYVKDQLSLNLDDKSGYEHRYDSYKHDDSPYLTVKVIDGDSNAINCISSDMRTISIDVDRYVAGDATLEVTLKFPKRSTYIGEYNGTTFSNTFTRTITIKR